MTRISGGLPCATLLALVALPVGLLAFGCSTADTAPAPGEAPNVGSIGLALQAGGVTLNSVSYTILGNGFSKSGSIDIANSTQISAVIGNIPAGNGYSITLNASDAANALTNCTGSANFNIAPGATTSALVHLQCRTPAKNGSVLVNGTVNICPVLNALSVMPAETTVGNSVGLFASATDVDHLPSALSYSWTASGGTLSDATTASAALICTNAGVLTVTLSVSDGDCSDILSQLVVCSAAPSGSAGAGGALSAGAGGAPNAGSGGTMNGGTGGAAGSFSGASGNATTGSAGSAGASGGAGLIKINEIESNGGIPDDWVELYNPGTQPIDISGYLFRDNDDTHVYAIPAGTVVLPGAYFVMDTGVTGFNFGLGSTDATRLYLPDGTTIVDSFNWTAHAATTYGRCPNGSGAFSTTASSTKGSANDCASSSGGSGGAGGTAGGFGGSAGTGGAAAGSAGSAGAAGSGGAPSAFNVWPGGDSVVTVDVANTFPSNLSGLLFEPGQSGNPDVLWGVQNGPSKLYRLLWNGTVWTADTAQGWSGGKTLSYTTGLGAPDSEGVTKTAFGTNPLYVSTERDNNNNAVSRLSVLMFDDTSALSTINAVKDWNLTADLPVAGANLGLEAIAWVPDAYLVSKGFIDESKNLPYDPASYPDHAGGIFFVGLEQNGMIYGYALDHAGGGFTRVATVVSGNPSIMDLNFDRDVGYLWAACDNTCAGRTNVLDIDTRVGSLTLGKFYIRQGFERPSAMPDTNNEGFTVTPESTCAGGFKSVFYADDNDLDGHAIRRGSIPCGAFL